MDVRVFKALKTPKKIKVQFPELCLDPEDSSLLNDFIKSTPFDFVFIIQKNEKVIAWAHINTWERNGNVVTFQCFVSKKYRRKGYGTLLYKKTCELFPDKKIGKFAHNDASGKFFNKMKAV